MNTVRHFNIKISLKISFSDRFYYDRFYCLFHEFYNTLFIIAVPLTGVSITMVAIDRFIATLKPGQYYSLGKMYAWKMNLCKFRYFFHITVAIFLKI